MIVGPNGSGKTTLLSVINGYRWLTRGKVIVMGERFRKDGPEGSQKEDRDHELLSGGLDPSQRKCGRYSRQWEYGSSGLWRGMTKEEEKRALCS